MTIITIDFPDKDYKTIAHYKIDNNLQTLSEAVIAIVSDYAKDKK